MPEYTIVIVGKTGHGKSRLGNSILNLGKEKVFEFSAMGSSVTKTCKKETARVDDVTFNVIDTPGVMDTGATETEILAEISRCRELCPNGVNAVLLVISYGERFTKEEENSIADLQKAFGDSLFKYGIVIITKGDVFEAAKEDGEFESFDQYLSKEPPYFKEVLKKVEQRYVLFNNRLKGDAAKGQRTELISKIEAIMRNVGDELFRIPDVPCFPATSTVLIDGQYHEKMANLQIGAKIVSITEKDFAPVKLDTVYFFSHAASDVLAPFVCITTAGGKTLHLSEGHYLYVGKDALKTGELVTAREVKVGDVVHVVDALDEAPRPEEVTEIKVEIMRGLYCPHTLGGSLVVDGVCVSSYTEVIPPRVAHGLLWPIRVLYRIAPDLAANIAKPQGQMGRPTWLGWLHDHYMAWL